MTRLEFDNENKALKQKADFDIAAIKDKMVDDMKQLAIKFANSNNDIANGDIISDATHQIKVDECAPVIYPTKAINPYGYQLPFMGYTGYVVYKGNDGQMIQSASRRTIFQVNVRKKNGQRYVHKTF